MQLRAIAAALQNRGIGTLDYNSATWFWEIVRCKGLAAACGQCCRQRGRVLLLVPLLLMPNAACQARRSVS